MRLEGKVVVVTGAGSGIGRALTLALLQRGAEVAAADLRSEGLEETARVADAGERISLHTLDISDRDAVRALPAKVLEAHGRVDGVINNAGIIQPFHRVQDLDDAVIDRVLRVNLYGVIDMVRAFLPHLLERPEAHLANVSSMGGFFPFPGQTIYGASKAGVKLLTEGLYAELRDTNVTISLVMPGAVATDISMNSGVGQLDAGSDAPIEPLSPSDAADQILDGIERNRLHILVGKDAKAMWWASRVAPKTAFGYVQKQMKSLLDEPD